MSALVPSAAAATGGILWAASGGTIPVLLIVLVSASGLALCGYPLAGPRAQRAGGMVALCAGAIVLGAGSHAVGASSTRVRLPVAPHEVVRAEGRLVHAGGDADRPVATVRLIWASSEWVDGEAGGELRVLASGAVPLSAGERVTLELEPGGSAVWRDDGGSLWAHATVTAAAAGGAPGVGSPPTPRGGSGVSAAVRLRGAIAAAVEEVSGVAAPLVSALLIGEDASFDPRVRLLFRRSGTLHLLALSGMHLAVIALLVRTAAGALVSRRMAAWLAVAAGFAYVGLAGPRPGLVRAALLVLVATGASEVDRPRPLIELLAACFLAQLVVQPGSSGSLAFQLSYLSLLGIAAVAQPFAEAVRPWVPPTVAGPLGAGVGAQLATTPLVLARFGAWYPVGVVASVALGPVVLLVMIVGLAAVAFRLLGFASVGVITRPVLELLYRVVEAGAWFFSGAPSFGPGADAKGWGSAATAVGALAVLAGLSWQARRGATARGVAEARR